MDSAEGEFVRLLEDMAVISGADRWIATLFALVYLAPGEISLEELAEKSGYSLPSVSMKVNALERLGIVRKCRRPNSRKTFVSTQKDLHKLFCESVFDAQKKKFRLARERFPAIVEHFRESAKTEEDKKEFELVRSYQKQVAEFEEMFEAVISGINCERKKRGMK